MRHSILWRILLPFILLLIGTLTVFSLYLSSFLRNTYLERTKTSLLAEARLVRSDLESALLSDPLDPQIDAKITRYAGLLNARITIILADGTVVSESERPAEGMENHFARPEVQQALLNKEATEIRYSDTLGADMLYAATPLRHNNRIVAIIRLAAPLNYIQENLSKIYASLMVVAVVAALAATLIAILITRTTLRPLGALSEAVAQISKGVLPEIGEPLRKDELSQLQLGFRGMAEQLRRQINELGAEREKLEAVLMNMTDAILIVDKAGLVQRLNPAAQRMFNIDATKAIGRSLIEVVRQHQLAELWQRCRQSDSQQSLPIEISTERLFVQAIATPLGQEMEGAVLMAFQDLTRVRRLESVRRDFVSNVSHELRTPLASLKALAETLNEGALEDPPAARRFLKQMDTEIDNLTQMVQELLELSRIESGRVPLQLSEIDPCEFLGRAIERMRLQAERAGLALELHCSDELPRVRADSERIQQVLVNLIHNAVKFTQPGGRIVVSASPDKSELVFAISDTGVGILPDDLTRIFERFYKADRSRSGGGTGLGLSISRHLVEAHGGRIWAASQPNQGSTFYFTLPIV